MMLKQWFKEMVLCVYAGMVQISQFALTLYRKVEIKDAKKMLYMRKKVYKAHRRC